MDTRSAAALFALLVPWLGPAAAGAQVTPSKDAARSATAPADPAQAAPRAASAPSDAPSVTDPKALVRQVLSANPELKALEAQIEALQQGIPQASVWKDPMAGVEYSNMPLTSPWLGHSPMSGIQFRAEQTFPAPGKIQARVDVAKARVDVGEDALVERRDQLAGLVQDTYWQLALTRQLKKVTEDHIGLVNQLIDVVRVSYEVGRASQHDLLNLEVLRDELKDQLGDFDRTARSLLASLNATLHRPAGTPIGTPDETPLPEPEAELDALVKAAEANRGLLAQYAAEAHVQALAADRAEVEKRPDVTAWLGYRIRGAVPGGDPGEDQITAGVSIPLPWFWNDERWGAKAQEHRARRSESLSRRAAALDDIRGKIESTLAVWNRAHQKALRYGKKLVPEAHRTLDATLAAYRVGRADFSTLYQAELVLLDFERTIRTARSDAARAAVNVETLTGQAAPSEENQ